jgi:hypothetical protein
LNTTNASVVIDELTPDTTYTVQVSVIVAFVRSPAISIEARTDSEPIHPSAPVDFKAEFMDLNTAPQQPSSSTASAISALKLKWKKPLYNANLIAKYRLYYQHLHHGPIAGSDTKSGVNDETDTFHPNDVDSVSQDENDIAENGDLTHSAYGYMDATIVDLQNAIAAEKYIDIDVPSEAELTDNYYEFLLEDLVKYSTYKFRLVALDRDSLLNLSNEESLSNATRAAATEYQQQLFASSSAEIVVETPSDVPDGAPEGLRVDTLNTTAVLVSWQQPAVDKRNGLIVGYKISIKENEKQIWHSSVDSEPRSKIISGLLPGSKYSVRITARTSNGSGPASDWIIAETFAHEMDGN